MTHEEAKYYFQQLMNRMDGVNLYKPEGGIATGAKEQLFGVIDMALERMIPKTPIVRECTGFFRGFEFLCPRCLASLATDDNDPYENWWLQFCNECGQRIDMECVE